MIPIAKTKEAELKCKAIVNIRKTIQTPKRYFFVKNQENIRFCYLIPRKGEAHRLRPEYIVFTFLKYEHLELAAKLLADAGLIDEYEAYKGNDTFSVKLFVYTCYEHTDAKGRRLWCTTRREKEWSDLKLTKADAENFLAHFYYNTGAKVINMFSDNSNTKRIA